MLTTTPLYLFNRIWLYFISIVGFMKFIFDRTPVTSSAMALLFDAKIIYNTENDVCQRGCYNNVDNDILYHDFEILRLTD